ncbi:MAG: folate-binding protein YgfZ [Aquificae bacterium]|nr:folate-binding protein YgfZ [Aquificota bacterium]
MKWVKLNRPKIKVEGEKLKLQMRGMSAQEEHTHFLQGLLTNDVRSLRPYTFNYNLMLKQNGAPVDELFVYKIDDHYILDTSRPSEEVLNDLNKRKLSLRVYLKPLSYEHVFIWGEGSEDFVKDAFGVIPQDFRIEKVGDELFLASNPLRVGEKGYEIFGKKEELMRYLPPGEPSEEEFEDKRIRNCVPKLGKELREGFSPLEAGLAQKAISFTKGCYVGQEAIARVHFKGRTPRALALLKLSGAKEGEELLDDGKKVGLITSVSPISEYALGYVLRERAKEGKTLKTKSGEATVERLCS